MAHPLLRPGGMNARGLRAPRRTRWCIAAVATTLTLPAGAQAPSRASTAGASTPQRPAVGVTSGATAPVSPATVAPSAGGAVVAPGSAPGVTPEATPGATAAEGEAVGPMTLGQALAYARAHQPARQVAHARLEAARADADVTRSQWRPSAGVTAQIFGGTMNNTTAMSLGSSAVDLPRIGGTRSVAAGGFSGSLWRPYGSTLVAAGVNQLLFDFGRVAAQAAAADAAVQIERQRLAVDALDLDESVREAYFAVLAARGVLRAAEAAFERARAHRDFARAGVDQGLRPPVELTRSEADLTRFEAGRMRARGALQAAQGVFAAVVAVPALTLDAAGTAPPEGDLPSLAQAVREAQARDPVVRIALAQVRQQELRTRAIGAELRPDLGLTASVSGRAGGALPSSGVGSTTDGLLPNVPNWDVGLVLTWTLFDGTVQARQDASRRREAVARANLAAVQQQQVAAIQGAYVVLRTAREVLPGLTRSVDAARANLAQADARFRQGVGTSVELADAEALLADAEIQLAAGTFEIARARASFGRAIAEP